MKTAGGQAVIEGVMMRYGNKINTSVRVGNKIISQKKILKKHSRIAKLFFIRGIVNLYEMLKIGVGSLIWSAEQYSDEDEKPKKNKKGAKKSSDNISKTEIAFSLIIAFAFAILLFIVAPFYLTKLVYKGNDILFNVVDGVIRVLIFVIYVSAISLMKDVKRVFQYHGAEHKTVHCFEAGKKLTADNVKKFSTLHTRCGTSFLIIVLAISIIVFSFITREEWYYKIGYRIILLPVIAGISYEILKFADKQKKSRFISIVNKPGLWIQKITTKEPTKKQIEVAIHSLKKVI